MPYVICTLRNTNIKVIIIKSGFNEYQVRVRVSGKPKPRATYYTTSRRDAFDTANDMLAKMHARYGRRS